MNNQSGKHQWGTFFKDRTLYRTYETAKAAESAANRAAGRGKMLYTKPLAALRSRADCLEQLFEEKKAELRAIEQELAAIFAEVSK